MDFYANDTYKHIKNFIGKLEMNRRNFITQTALVGGIASMSPFESFAATNNTDKERFKFALSQYSLRAMLKDKSLDPLDFPAFSADKFGIKAIDLWEGGLPKDKLNDMSYMESLRKRSEQAGSDLFLLMAGSVDSRKSMMKNSVKKFIPSLKRAQVLGCTYLRVFLRADSLENSVETLKLLCDEATKYKIIIAIEPGTSALSMKGAFLAEVYKKVKHPYLTLMPDFGKLKDNVYDGTQAMLPYAKTIYAKMHSFDDKGQQPDFDYGRLAKIIYASEYKGYIAIEWEGKKLKPIEGVLASKKLILDSFSALGATVK